MGKRVAPVISGARHGHRREQLCQESKRHKFDKVYDPLRSVPLERGSNEWSPTIAFDPHIIECARPSRVVIREESLGHISTFMTVWKQSRNGCSHKRFVAV